MIGSTLHLLLPSLPLQALPEMLGRFPTCMSIFHSDGTGGVGLSDGSVSLWGPSALRTAIQAAEEAERAKKQAQFSREEAQGGGCDGPAGDTADNLDVSHSSESGTSEEISSSPGMDVDDGSIEALPFVTRWDEKTGEVALHIPGEMNERVVQSSRGIWPLSLIPSFAAPGNKIQVLKQRGAEIPLAHLRYTPDGQTVRGPPSCLCITVQRGANKDAS